MAFFQGVGRGISHQACDEHLPYADFVDAEIRAETWYHLSKVASLPLLWLAKSALLACFLVLTSLR